MLYPERSKETILEDAMKIRKDIELYAENREATDGKGEPTNAYQDHDLPKFPKYGTHRHIGHAMAWFKKRIIVCSDNKFVVFPPDLNYTDPDIWYLFNHGTKYDVKNPYHSNKKGPPGHHFSCWSAKCEAVYSQSLSPVEVYDATENRAKIVYDGRMTQLWYKRQDGRLITWGARRLRHNAKRKNAQQIAKQMAGDAALAASLAGQ